MAVSFFQTCGSKVIQEIDHDDAEDTGAESDATESTAASEGDVGPRDDPQVAAPGAVGAVLRFLSDLVLPQFLCTAPGDKSLRPPEQTVIFLDWDDTLLCTTYLGVFDYMDVTPAVARQLRYLEVSVEKLLRLAKSLGRVFIVTNAEAGWVEHSAQRFMPKVLPALEGIPVVSARTRFAPIFPDASIWKTKTFLELHRHLDGHASANLLSVGDGPTEMAAVKALGKQFASARVKTIKFRMQPTPAELQDQLECFAEILEQIVHSGSDLEILL